MHPLRTAKIIPFQSRRSVRPSPELVRGREPLGQLLLQSGVLSQEDLIKALAIQAREETQLGQILLNHGMVSEAELFGALARQSGADRVDLMAEPPLHHLRNIIDLGLCLKENIVPWKHIGGALLIATSRPDRFTAIRRQVEETAGPCRMVLAPEQDIQQAVMQLHGETLVNKAETRTPHPHSCRDWQAQRMMRLTLAAAILLLAGFLVSPVGFLTALCALAITVLLLNIGLKLSTAISQIGPTRRRNAASGPPPRTTRSLRLPVVSILVPLYHEREVASRLITRLKRLNYPKELLDICLVVEADDTTTRDTLAKTRLPLWARVIEVPRGTVRTKPRAMNFALDFCRGSIIGIYDAEDAPHPDQIHQIVRRFHERGPQVACVQGILDFYNPRSNWLSRCFTIEYASWFRLFLPGLERLGFAVPLGGTTLFFRRQVLEELGGWDSHNVTEDADLGIRLARHGYRTEIVHTVTEEEANCRLVPWVKQRSRWLKGFAMTWAVHMRQPLKLLKELGPKRFFGVQILFLGTWIHFLLAPLLWSFWIIPLGYTHPLQQVVPAGVIMALGGMFVLAEGIGIAIGIFAVAANGKRFLIPWVPTMHLYFPLGTLAAYKAFYELLTRPFYWDKTSHGIFRRTETTEPEDAPYSMSENSG